MRLSVLAAVCALAAGVSALAPGATGQPTRPAPSNPAPSNPAPRDSVRAVVTLPPVVVIATRTGARLLDAPLAVSVVDRERIAGGAGVGLERALAGVPGVLAQSRSGFTDLRLTIRGFGARGAGDRSNAGTARGVRVVVDGFPETEPDGRTAFDLLDVMLAERVEVVRSNASALWGNAAGGLVSVSTVPSVERAWARATATAGGFGLRQSAAETAVRVGSGRAFAAVTRATFDGWRARSSAERSLVRAGYVGAAGARTTVAVFVTAADVRYDIPGPLTRADFDAAPRAANATYAARFERRHNRTLRLGTTLAQATPGGGTLSLSGFASPKALQRSERGTFRDFTRAHVGGGVSLVQPLGKLLGTLPGAAGGAVGRVVGPLRLVAGADGQGQDGAALFYSLSPTGGRGTALRTNKAEGARTGGVYAQIDADHVGGLAGGLFDGRLAASLGARLDALTYDVRDYLTPALDDRRTYRHVTPRATLLYRVGEAHSVYAAIGGGIEAPAGNETDPPGTFGQDTVTAINPLLRPMRSTTAELGTRREIGRPGGATLAYDAALYLVAVRDDLVPYRGGRFYLNAGQTRRAGLELGLRASLPVGVAFDGALTVSDNRYLRYAVDSVHYGRPGKVADLRGNRVAGVPPLYGGAGVRVAPASRAGGLFGGRVFDGLYAEARVQGIGAYRADDANTLRVPGYAEVHLSVGLARARRVAPGLYVGGQVALRNALDRRYAASAFVNPDVVGGQAVYLEPGLPRHAVATLSVRFGE